MPEQQVVPTPAVNQTQGPNDQKKSTGLMMAIVAAFLIISVVAVVMLTYSKPQATTSTSTSTSDTSVNSTSDLDKVSRELDTTDLNSYQTDLDQNSSDASSF